MLDGNDVSEMRDGGVVAFWQRIRCGRVWVRCGGGSFFWMDSRNRAFTSPVGDLNRVLQIGQMTSVYVCMCSIMYLSTLFILFQEARRVLRLFPLADPLSLVARCSLALQARKR